ALNYQRLSSRDWVLQTSTLDSKPFLAVDRKISTRWTTDRAQVPGDFYQIDLGKTETVTRLRLLVGKSKNDFPRRFTVHFSMDGRQWELLNPKMTPVLLNWTGETLLEGSGDLDFIFPAVAMRYLKITQTGQDPEYYWSIHELELYRNGNKS
ncbi:MAG: discoidin domain-containing protein, partial [Thermodesulfobacteriota bacterium]